jgi:ADP-ribosylation factor-like protein 6
MIFEFLSRFFGSSRKKISVVVLGLDNSGKTTLVSHLKPDSGGKVFESTPTVGFTVEKIQKGNIDFTIFDMSGQSTYRGLWEAYYADVSAIIWVLDSSDKLRMTMAKHELHLLLAHKELLQRQVPILVFANKMDAKNSLSPVECMQLLGLDGISDKPWHITASNAVSGDGIDDGIQWLGESVKKLEVSKTK